MTPHRLFVLWLSASCLAMMAGGFLPQLWSAAQEPEIAHPMMQLECIDRWATMTGEPAMAYAWSTVCERQLGVMDYYGRRYDLVWRRTLTRAEIATSPELVIHGVRADR